MGLGNPGDRYDGTRHNVGAEVIEVLSERLGASLRASKQAALTAEVTLGSHRIALAFPQTFMNESGRSVRDLLKRYHIEDPRKLVVVHDELDLDVGRLKLKDGGGLAGHNGLKSIHAHTKTKDFLRLRIGIGRPPGRQSVSDFVLRRPGKSERVELDITIERAADAITTILENDIAAAMNTINAHG